MGEAEFRLGIDQLIHRQFETGVNGVIHACGVTRSEGELDIREDIHATKIGQCLIDT